MSGRCSKCDAPRVDRIGTEVTFDGATIARCPDEWSAELIVLAITYVGMSQDRIPPNANKRLAELTA